ncbi:flippase [Halogeometricum luteum]|uniref:Flippase n=1 Tax=Halogeometricum luteum TaxID=2950537 RepID=A0ABU2G435_9EURY|nr:flippase [Halogeometricum sp. S3BR5-2]MDS0295236.1 flippase [Halogeometricum sp. S3BR5-2]
MTSEESVRERMASGLKVSFVSQVLYVVANAGLIVVLTRYLLTPEGYGLLSFALSILGVTQLFLGLGLAKSGARFVTEYIESDETQVRHIVRTTLLYVGVATVVVSVVFWAVGGRLAGLLGRPAVEPFLAVGVGYLALYPFAIAVRLLFNAFNRVEWSGVFRTVDGVVRFVFAAGFVLAGFGAVGALYGYLAGFLVSAVLGLVVFYRRFYRSLPTGGDPESGLRRRIARYGVPLTVTSGADVLDKRVDMVLVGVLVNPVAVGYYTLAKQIADFAIVPARSIDTTLAPRLGERKASDQGQSASRIYESALRHVLLLYVPAGVGLALVAEPTIRYVFGANYLDAVPLVQLFGVLIVIDAVNQITTNSLDYLGRGRERAIANGGTSVANFVLNLLLIPAFGALGAAVATVVTHAGYTVINVSYIYREFPFRVRRLLFESGVVVGISAGMGAIVYYARTFVSGLPSLLAVIALGGAVWAALAVYSGLLDTRLVESVLS